MAVNDVPILQLGYLQQRFVLGSPCRVRRSLTSVSYDCVRNDNSGDISCGCEEQVEKTVLTGGDGSKADVKGSSRANEMSYSLVKGIKRVLDDGHFAQALFKTNCRVTFIAIVGGMCWRVFRQAK